MYSSGSKLNFTLNLIAGLLLCFIYGYIAYFIDRSDFSLLILLIGFSFVATYLVLRYSDFTFRQIFGLAIIYRLIFIVSIPQLSQDFFRFFWDGQLLINGINPYLNNVNHFFLENQTDFLYQADILKEGMGDLSAGNYSNYPPVSQLLYAISAFAAQESIMIFLVILRLLLVSFDLVFIYFGKKLLKYLNKDPKTVFLYALNPLCIIEITGNLHLEGVMISLFLISVYFLIKKQFLVSGIILSLSVGTKLISLVALPLMIVFLWRRYTSSLKYKSTLIFLFGFILVLSAQFLPFFNTIFIDNFSESIGLWFGKFEFNASVYYLVRWLGFQVYGYNIIQSYGMIMPLVTIAFFMIIIFKTRPSIASILENFLWMLTVYFLLATTVHPWYILFPLAIGVFTSYRFGLMWSFLVFLSYNAYSTEVFYENLIITTIEYVMLLGFIFYELRRECLLFKFRKKSSA
jgi:hypothetical protein